MADEGMETRERTRDPRANQIRVICYSKFNIQPMSSTSHENHYVVHLG